MQGGRGLPILATLLLVAVATPVVGQVFVDISESRIPVQAGEATSFDVILTNPTNRPYFVAGSTSGNLSEFVVLNPARFALAPNATAQTTVTIDTPRETTFTEGPLHIDFTIVDRESGDTLQDRTTLLLEIERPHRFLGVFDNPLPAPFDAGWGMFAAEMAGWVLVGLVTVSVIRWILEHMVVPNAAEFIQEEMVHRVSPSIFYLIVVLGLNYAWRLVPPTPLIDIVDRTLNVVAVLVAGVLAYKTTGAALYYYGSNIAGETETKVDDVLVPVLEKLTAAIIIGLTTFYTFQILGVDLSFLVAGGLVAGLVISMAAQDTLSNFFSGLYLLIDRPFREGDDIELETGEICRVDEVGMRSCRLYHYRQHQQIIVPNNELASKRVINLAYPDLTYRLVIPVSVAYGTDLPTARKVLREVAEESENVLDSRGHTPLVFVRSFGDSGINLELRAFIDTAAKRNAITTELVMGVHKALEESGIEIPFPQRVVWMRRLAEEGLLDAEGLEELEAGDGAPENLGETDVDEVEPEDVEPDGDQEEGDGDGAADGSGIEDLLEEDALEGSSSGPAPEGTEPSAEVEATERADGASDKRS